MPRLLTTCSRCARESTRASLRLSMLWDRPYASSSTSTSAASPGPSKAATTTPSSCASSRFITALPPIRYHIFREKIPYSIGLKLQNDLVQRRIDRKKDGEGKMDVVLLLGEYPFCTHWVETLTDTPVEHIPTYTTGRRDNSLDPSTLHPEEKKVQHVGAEFHITKRGGQVTYHGPGQLVGYPLFDLNAMEMPTRCYVEYLQTVLEAYVRSKGVEGVLAPHPEGHVGIFASPTEKVASIGIHLQHRITSHGFAMNITPEPIPWFDLVLACGLADVHAVNLHDLMVKSAVSNGVLPAPTPSVKQVAEELIPRFEEVFGRQLLSLKEAAESKASEGILEDPSELEEVSELISTAEEEAKKVNRATGGWANAPDLSRQEQGS